MLILWNGVIWPGCAFCVDPQNMRDWSNLSRYTYGGLYISASDKLIRWGRFVEAAINWIDGLEVSGKHYQILHNLYICAVLGGSNPIFMPYPKYVDWRFLHNFSKGINFEFGEIRSAKFKNKADMSFVVFGYVWYCIITRGTSIAYREFAPRLPPRTRPAVALLNMLLSGGLGATPLFFLFSGIRIYQRTNLINASVFLHFWYVR